MSTSIAPGSSADVNVKVTALTTNQNVPVTYKTIILKKNLVNGVNTLTQEMMSSANTKYVIKYDYMLGEDITIPENCILKFDGGSLKNHNENNYKISLQNTIIKGEVKIINIDFIGTPIEYKLNSFPGETYLDKLENALNNIYTGTIDCSGIEIYVSRPLSFIYETIGQDNYTKDYRRIRIFGAKFTFSEHALFEEPTYDLMTPLFTSCSFIGEADGLYVYNNIDKSVIGMIFINCYFKRIQLINLPLNFIQSIYMSNCDIYETNTTFIQSSTVFNAKFVQNRFEGGNGTICQFSHGANPSNFIFDNNLVEGRFSGTVFRTGGGINFVISNNYFETIYDGLLEVTGQLDNLVYDFKVINNYWENRNITTQYGHLLFVPNYYINNKFKDTVFANNSIFFKEGQAEAFALRGFTFKNKGIESTNNLVVNGSECYSSSGQKEITEDTSNFCVKYAMGDSWPVIDNKEWFAPCFLFVKGTDVNDIVKTDIYLLTFDLDYANQSINVNTINIGGTTHFTLSTIVTTLRGTYGVYAYIGKDKMKTCSSYIINTSQIVQQETANNI